MFYCYFYIYLFYTHIPQICKLNNKHEWWPWFIMKSNRTPNLLIQGFNGVAVSGPFFIKDVWEFIHAITPTGPLISTNPYSAQSYEGSFGHSPPSHLLILACTVFLPLFHRRFDQNCKHFQYEIDHNCTFIFGSLRFLHVCFYMGESAAFVTLALASKTMFKLSGHPY